MACSEARLAANRANALKSTGPRTEAGKEASRRNSLKHGLTGSGMVVPGEDAAEVARESATLVAELAGDGSAATRLLAERVATLSVRLKRSARHEFGATAERTRIAAAEFDAARGAEADRLFDAIDEGANRDELLGMPEGLDRLDAALAGLRASAGAGRWSAADAAQLARCLGGDARDESTGADRIVGRIDEARARLAALRPGLARTEIDLARAAAVDRALVDDSPETLRARRYEAATERALHQALRAIRHWRRPAPAEAPAPTPAPAPKSPPHRDPLTDPSYKIPAHVVREAERMRERLIGLPPLGPGESIAGLGSIFPGDDAMDDFDFGSMEVDDEDDAEPAPRGRSRYEDKRKRPKLGR